ncbi:MAG: FAD:protein FMN transferase [Balneolaceae bacterium]|nr:FAD:protein FMN transferase [Balneolaceae bacterium]
MKPLFLQIVFFALLFAGNTTDFQAQDLDRYTFQSRHMGTQISIILYAENDSIAKEASDAAFARIEELNQIMSDYIEESELNRLSRKSGSGEWMPISSDLFEVLEESIRISEKTDGLFDVTIGPLTHHWRYVRMHPEPVYPDEATLDSLRNLVDYQAIELNEGLQSARLNSKNMQLDFGGIAKGYAAQEAINILKEFGIASALVDAGGDITTGSTPPGRASWDVAIPKGRVDGDMKFSTVQFSGKTLTTSGDMYQFAIIDGQRYSHIVNPKTGLGSTDQIQATVLSSNGMYADAFASALTLMDPEEGIRLIEKIEEAEALIFREVDGEVKQWMTPGMEVLLK